MVSLGRAVFWWETARFIFRKGWCGQASPWFGNYRRPKDKVHAALGGLALPNRRAFRLVTGIAFRLASELELLAGWPLSLAWALNTARVKPSVFTRASCSRQFRAGTVGSEFSAVTLCDQGGEQTLRTGNDFMKKTTTLDDFGNSTAKTFRQCAALAGLCLSAAVLQPAMAGEDAPHRPFALWADVPDAGQFVAGFVYERSEAYHIWAGRAYENITVVSGGEHYGIDNNQGFLALQYGITKRWAADLNLGGTTVGWRDFDPNQGIRSTVGVMDLALGFRYQLVNESKADSPWLPTLTFRAGGILPGSYNQDIAFAPGLRSAAIEPEVLLRKHVGWPGLGVYGDALYRWNHTTGNDQYITVVGLFQQIKGWELDAGYRHLQTIGGSSIVFDPTDPAAIFYPRDVREINDAIEAGFSYTTATRHIRYGFHSRTTFDGANTDKQFWLGASVDIPFDNFLGIRHD
jgi:hypothetical protein